MKNPTLQYSYIIDYTIVFDGCAYSNVTTYDTNTKNADDASAEFIRSKMNGDHSIKNIFILNIRRSKK